MSKEILYLEFEGETLDELQKEIETAISNAALYDYPKQRMMELKQILNDKYDNRN